MLKIHKRREILIFFILLTITLPFKQVKASSLISFNPINFLTKTAEIVVGRTTDLIYYLAMQKKYIFNDFADPNTYPDYSLPINLQTLLNSTTTVLTKIRTTSLPLAVSTSVLPEAEGVSSEVKVQEKPSQSSSITPALVVKSKVTTSLPQVSDSGSSKQATNLLILNYTNSERADNSIKSLVSNATLDKIAQARVSDLFENQYFDHESPDGKTASDLAKKYEYNYSIIGENLALGNFDGYKSIVAAWMKSPGHRANILNEKYQELGVAVEEGVFNGEKSTIAVQIFGTSQTDCIKPSQTKKDLIDETSATIKEMQSKAQIMLQDLTQLKSNPEIDQSYYNQKVQEYNYLAKQVNNSIVILREMINTYNAEVSRFNSCIKL